MKLSQLSSVESKRFLPQIFVHFVINHGYLVLPREIVIRRDANKLY